MPLGGKNEKDETDVDTVVRETWEEVGLDLNSKDFIPVGRLDDREITSAQDGKLLMMLSPFGQLHKTILCIQQFLLNLFLQCISRFPHKHRRSTFKHLKLRLFIVSYNTTFKLKLFTLPCLNTSYLGVPLKFFLSTEPYNFRPMKIKLMKKMPPYLKAMAPVAQELFGNMEVPAIDLPDSNPPPRLWGLTLGMTSQLIDMTEESISGRPHRSKNEKHLTFVKLDKSPPKYTYPDIAALVWLFYKAGLGWEKLTGTTPKHMAKR